MEDSSIPRWVYSFFFCFSRLVFPFFLEKRVENGTVNRYDVLRASHTWWCVPLYRVQGYRSRNTGPRHSYPVTAPTLPSLLPCSLAHALPQLPTPVWVYVTRVCVLPSANTLCPSFPPTTLVRLSNEVYEIVMPAVFAPARYRSMKKKKKKKKEKKTLAEEIRILHRTDLFQTPENRENRILCARRTFYSAKYLQSGVAQNFFPNIHCHW